MMRTFTDLAAKLRTPAKKSVRQLQREIDGIGRSYERQVERVKQQGASQEERMALLHSASFETDMAQEQIQMILSARLFHDANRVGIPSPRYTGADSDLWEQTHGGQVYLSLKGQSELRSRIRAEKRERWEARAIVIRDIAVPIAGLIGAITGLVAVIRK